MARKRMIDPSIWVDDGMAELTPRQQLLYIGLFSNADDEGRMKGSAASIRLILPTVYGGEPLEVIERDLAAVLEHMSCLTAYSVDGKPYLYFTNYTRWQKISHAYPSELPHPPGHDSTTVPEVFRERSMNGTEPFDDHSPLVEISKEEIRGEEEKLEETRGKETRARAKSEARRGDDPPRAGPPIHSEDAERHRVQALTPAFDAIPGFCSTDRFWRTTLDNYAALDLDEEAVKIAAWAQERGKNASAATVLSWLKREATSPPRQKPREAPRYGEKYCAEDGLTRIAGKYASYVVH